jgi:hypothetical protein
MFRFQTQTAQDASGASIRGGMICPCCGNAGSHDAIALEGQKLDTSR